MYYTFTGTNRELFEDKFGGEENLRSLVASSIMYFSGKYTEEEPYFCEEFCLTRRAPVIAVGVQEISDYDVIMDMIIDGERVMAYLGLEALMYIILAQRHLYEDPDCGWSKEDIDNYEFVVGKVFMIDSADDMISSIEIIDHDIAYGLVDEYIAAHINEFRKVE